MQTILRVIYPPQCASCGTVVEDDFSLCGSCWRDVHFITGLSCCTCGAPLMGEDDGALSCDDCTAHPRPWRSGTAAILYTAKGRALTLRLKHADQTQLARVAGKWMAGRLGPLDPATLVVPVPLHWSRRLRRRYNQAALLARDIALRTGLTYAPDILYRHRVTPSLDRKSRAERDAVLRGAIATKQAFGGHPVLLVDDVLTTGATLSACTEALMDAGAPFVDVITLARVAKEG